jgi:hypothetical protein
VTDAERGLHGRVQLKVGAGLDLNAIKIYYIFLQIKLKLYV